MHIPKPMWTKASAENLDKYNSDLNYLHAQKNISKCVISCNNVMCTQKTHRNLIKELYDHMVSSCLTTSKSNIPYSSNTQIGTSSLDGLNGSKSTMKKKHNFLAQHMEELWFSSRISCRYKTFNTCSISQSSQTGEKKPGCYCND